MFKKIIKSIINDLQISNFKKLFKNNKNEHIEKIAKKTQELINKTKEEIQDIDQMTIELKKEFLNKALNKFEKIKCKTDKQFCFLLTDDNLNSIKLMQNDLNYLFKKPSLIENDIQDEKIIKERDELYKKLKNIDYEILKVYGDDAPYKIIKSLSDLKIDYAIIDIIFGGILVFDEKTYIFDGIDIAECILKNNPKAVIVFYTGCNLSESSEEYNKIQKLLQKYPYQIFITDKDIDDEARIKKILKSLKAFIKFNQRNENEN